MAWQLHQAGFELRLISSVALARTREAMFGTWDKNDPKDAQVIELLGDHPDFIRLQQIPGIGPIIALTILSEAGDLRRFKHHRQFLKFCGMNLSTRQSGSFKGQTRLSKYGNARLRRSFWMAGQVAIMQRENSFKDKFNRYVKNDRNNKDLRRKAYTAVAAKVARIAYAIIKNNVDYRPFFEAAIPGGSGPATV